MMGPDERLCDTSPWMSEQSPESMENTNMLPRCAVLSFQREGNTVHWKPWRNTSPSARVSISQLYGANNNRQRHCLSHEGAAGVLDLTSIMTVAMQHGMSAPPPPRAKRKFVWSKLYRTSQPIEYNLESPGTRRTSGLHQGEFLWTSPTRLSIELPSTPDSPVSYREFGTPVGGTPIDLTVASSSDRKSRNLDSPGIALFPSNSSYTPSQSCTDSRMTYDTLRQTTSSRSIQSKRKRFFRKVRFLLHSPTHEKSSRGFHFRRVKTSNEFYSTDSDEGDLRRISTDVYMEFMNS